MMPNKLKKTLSNLSEKKKLKKKVIKPKKKKEELEKELEELEEEGEDDEEEEEDDDDEEDQDDDDVEPKKVVTDPSPEDQKEVIEQEVMRLRDLGVYHAEVLYQMIQNNSIQERIAVALEKIIELVEK